jgi:hypothetical protein
MADTTPSKSPSAPTDQRKAIHEFCEKVLRDFEAIPPAQRTKGFYVTRSQTISGDTIQRTFVLQFDLKLTGCEFPDQ